jgi:hypothetical protein
VQPKEDAASGSANGKVDAAALARLAWHIVKLVVRKKARLSQRMRQQSRFPGPIIPIPPMLQRTSATAAKMAARRLDPGLAGLRNHLSDGVPAVAPRLQSARRYGLTRQRERKVQRRAVWEARDSIPFRADAIDAN